MNAQNIVSALRDLVANNLTVTHQSPITLRERQMAEHLADTVKLMASGQKVDYVEETTLDFDDFTDDEESEEEEDPMAVEKEGEEMDEDWSDKDAALEKYGLKNFSEEFMRQVVEFADWKIPKTERGRSWKIIHNSFKAVTKRQCIQRFRKYLEHHGTKRQKTQNLDELVFKKFVEARQKSLVIHDLDIHLWGSKVAKEIKLAEFHSSHDWLENFKYRHKLTSLKITNFVSHHQVENMDFIEKSKKGFVLEYNKVSAHFKPSEIFNTNQTGVEKELHSMRTISFSGDKKTFAAVQSKNAITYSYTLQPTISLDGGLLETIYLYLQEQGGKLRIKQIYKNIIRSFSRLF